MSQNYGKLVDFLKENIHLLRHDSGGGTQLDFPNFDLTPFDYLEFAEENLQSPTNSSRINCITHLKRAIECEMDTLLTILNIKRNIKSFPEKIRFVRDIGALSARSLDKLNKIRNKVEHDYEIPQIDDLEIYFDLASNFIHAIEGYIFILSMLSEVCWCFREDIEDMKYFSHKVDFEKNNIEFILESETRPTIYSFNIQDTSQCAKGLKAHFLLCKLTSVFNTDYVLAKLQDLPLLSQKASN
jgi:hypothetical protein